MAMFRFIVKNGDRSYDYNKSSGQYDSTTTDYVTESESFPKMLEEFLVWFDDGGVENKITLTYYPNKKVSK